MLNIRFKLVLRTIRFKSLLGLNLFWEPLNLNLLWSTIQFKSFKRSIRSKPVVRKIKTKHLRTIRFKLVQRTIRFKPVLQSPTNPLRLSSLKIRVWGSAFYVDEYFIRNLYIYYILMYRLWNTVKTSEYKVRTWKQSFVYITVYKTRIEVQ